MTLADYIRALVEVAAAAEPASLDRIRDIVGDQSAMIVVGDEAALARFEAGWLRVDPLAPNEPTAEVDGVGETDRQTVLELLAGLCEVHDAITQDRLRLRGTTDGIVRMSLAIEILIDVAVRAPGLQRLADSYRNDPTRPPMSQRRWQPPPDPAAARTAERAVLRRLGLLREPGRRW